MNGPRALPDRGEPHGLVGQHFGQVQPLAQPFDFPIVAYLPHESSRRRLDSPESRQVAR